MKSEALHNTGRRISEVVHHASCLTMKRGPRMPLCRQSRMARSVAVALQRGFNFCTTEDLKQWIACISQPQPLDSALYP